MMLVAALVIYHYLFELRKTRFTISKLGVSWHGTNPHLGSCA
jgi:hypothetical protein